MGKRKRPKPYRNGNVVLGRRGTWWVADVRDEVTGERIRRIRLVDGGPEEEARRRLDIHAEAERAVKKQQSEYTVGDLWDMWLNDRAADGLRNNIHNANWVSLKPVFGNRLPRLLTKKDWRDYARSRFDLGRAPWTVITELSRMKRCLAWAVEDHLLERMPRFWLPSGRTSRERVLTPEEAQRLFNAAGDPHILIFIILAFTTAARHTAILDLTWDRVDWVKGTIQYDEMLPPDPMSKSWRKGRATVPMGSKLRAALEMAYAARQTDHVIEHGGRRLKTIRQGFRGAVERAGLGSYEPHPTKPDEKIFKTDVTPHTIRHTVSSWLKEKGVGAEFRKELLGHEDIDTQELYSHARPAYLEGTVEVLDKSLPQIPDRSKVVGGRKCSRSTTLVPVGQSRDLVDDDGEAPK